MMRFLVALMLTAFCLSMLAPYAFAEQTRLVEFEGRNINLEPYFEGFPYNGFKPYYEAGKLYYYHEGDTRTLREVNLSDKVDLTKGRVVSDIDFAKRNVWTTRYHNSGKLFWSGDEKNDEIINLYSLDPNTREIKKYTDVPYIYGWNWDEGESRVAYVARLGHIDERLGELRLLDLESGKETTIMKDTPEMRFTWTDVSWHPKGTGVVVTTLKDADRNSANLVFVDFKSKSWKILTDTSKPRNWPSAADKWISDNSFVYFSNEDGFRNAYTYDLESGESTQLTKFTRDIGEQDIIESDGHSYLVCVLENPIENTFVLVDPKDGRILVEQNVDVNVSIMDSEENRLLISATSATTKFRIDEVTVSKDGFVFANRVDIPADLKGKIVNSSVERIEFPTFDIDNNTGKTRMLHAFLYVPNNPLPDDKGIVMIQSFYGGGNYYSSRNQILAEAGIYVLSPSPRGSSGFGREFSALNDKDLGGNEIIDVIYAAKYISKKLGIPPQRVGVFGGSHGGYATMRCLTFPGEINGNVANFDWGFGMSHAGFSDIIHFYENCNIPDWVTMEAGDPATEADKLRDRSPLYHADKGMGKLLLTHGTNDSRVPIEGSRAMADSLRKYDKDVTLIEFEGQGHGIKGLENQIRFFRTWFEFLEKLEQAGDQASSS